MSQWVEAFTEEGLQYFYNVETGESQWEKPSSYISTKNLLKNANMKPPAPRPKPENEQLPENWHCIQDAKDKNFYYYNDVLEIASWHRPSLSLSNESVDNNDIKKLLDQTYYATFNGNLEDVKDCIAKGISLSTPLDSQGQTALHVACYAGHEEILDYFINSKVDLNLRDKTGTTALLYACSAFHLGICEMLLKNKADATLVNEDQNTTLHFLVRRSSPDKERYYSLLKSVLEAGVEINSKNYLGETPLMFACQHGNEIAVRFLLDHNSDFATTNFNGETALLYAESSDSEVIISLLQEKEENTVKKKQALLTLRDIKLEDYSKVIAAMKQDLKPRHRRFLLISHKSCVSGYDIVSWMVRLLGFNIRNRTEAEEYGQTLLDNNWFGAINEKKFKDSPKALYRYSTGKSLPPAPSAISVHLSDFENLNLILGEGGFAKVSLVRKKNNKKIYALKSVNKEKTFTEKKKLKSLIAERNILINDSPFLVHLHYTFQNDIEYYFVLDFIGGGDLSIHLRRLGRLTEKEVRFIISELLLALIYLHSRGVIYRDLKPENILLDIDGHICLTDFGLSRELEQEDDIGNFTACGTPNYSAPEILKGDPYGKSVDWWSLGIVMYQLLVGTVPFKMTGKNLGAFVKKILKMDIEYPGEYISESAKSFLDSKLLKLDSSKRIADLDSVKPHPFFKGIDWEKLQVKDVKSPLAEHAREYYEYKFQETLGPLKNENNNE